MALDLSVVPLSPSRMADSVGAAVFFVWFVLALVLMFAAAGRRSMPLVRAIGFVGAICVALLILWATAAQP
jgi:fumarate reductase subunit C